ncbi:hypothetical protein HanIR_Chr08g0350721 [Helianthus annuus]|nr:hypothetical protein HanIR_Chr08g0350721 [Helianthus annuus]
MSGAADSRYSGPVIVVLLYGGLLEYTMGRRLILVHGLYWGSLRLRFMSRRFVKPCS